MKFDWIFYKVFRLCKAFANGPPAIIKLLNCMQTGDIITD